MSRNLGSKWLTPAVKKKRTAAADGAKRMGRESGEKRKEGRRKEEGRKGHFQHPRRLSKIECGARRRSFCGHIFKNDGLGRIPSPPPAKLNAAEKLCIIGLQAPLQFGGSPQASKRVSRLLRLIGLASVLAPDGGESSSSLRYLSPSYSICQPAAAACIMKQKIEFGRGQSCIGLAQQA